MSYSGLFVKMHTGDPGEGGTAAAAANATRKALSLAEEMDASGRLVQDAVVAYTTGEVTTTETYAWVSYWDAVTGGLWIGNEDIANQAASAGVALNIAAGTILVTNDRAVEFATRKFLIELDADGSNDGWPWVDKNNRARTALQRQLREKQSKKFAREGAV